MIRLGMWRSDEINLSASSMSATLIGENYITVTTEEVNQLKVSGENYITVTTEEVNQLKVSG